MANYKDVKEQRKVTETMNVLLLPLLPHLTSDTAIIVKRALYLLGELGVESHVQEPFPEIITKFREYYMVSNSEGSGYGGFDTLEEAVKSLKTQGSSNNDDSYDMVVKVVETMKEVYREARKHDYNVEPHETEGNG